MNNKTKQRKQRKMWVNVLIWTGALLVALTIFGIIVAIQYSHGKKAAYEQLGSYDVKTIDTEFGTMSYLDEGSGEAILISHGIFGGYDQGIISLRELAGDNYRKISASRFGYPGSELPKNPSPENQAKVFKELLDELGIEKAYILSTSAGGAAGLRFALDYPDRTKGLILLSSGVPRDVENVADLGRQGPPNFLIHDFPMWFFTKYFGFVFESMFGSEVDDNLGETMLPVDPRRAGILADTEITNLDMDIHYDDYPVENIGAPILVIHAKDDPMAEFDNTEKFLKRVNAETVIFETGGHLITGHDDAVGEAVRDFVKRK